MISKPPQVYRALPAMAREERGISSNKGNARVSGTCFGTRSQPFVVCSSVSPCLLCLGGEEKRDCRASLAMTFADPCSYALTLPLASPGEAWYNPGLCFRMGDRGRTKEHRRVAERNEKRTKETTLRSGAKKGSHRGHREHREEGKGEGGRQIAVGRIGGPCLLAAYASSFLGDLCVLCGQNSFLVFTFSGFFVFFGENRFGLRLAAGFR